MTDNIIEEVLRHDAEMSPLRDVGTFQGRLDCDGATRLTLRLAGLEYPDEALEALTAGIAYYRTAAPKLARAQAIARVALHKIATGLWSAEKAAEIANAAQADITKILSEP